MRVPGVTRLVLVAIGMVTALPLAAQKPFPAVSGNDYRKWITDRHREAASVLQSADDKRFRSAIIDSALIEEVATALAAARAAVPDLAEAISTRRATALDVGLQQAAGRRVQSRGRLTSEGAPPRTWALAVASDGSLTGIRAIDSIARAYGATGGRLYAIDPLGPRGPTYSLVIWFRDYVYVPRLIEMFGRRPQVEVAMELEDRETYVSTAIEPADLKATEWTLVFREGRGDCPAGCTASIDSRVVYDRASRTARLVKRDTIGKP